MSVSLILVILAVIAFALAALKIEPSPRLSIGWLGLLLWALSTIV